MNERYLGLAEPEYFLFNCWVSETMNLRWINSADASVYFTIQIKLNLTFIQ